LLPDRHAGLTKLQSLDLSGTRISDIAPLATLRRLHYLDLSSTPVTVLSPLAGLTEMRRLDLRSTRADITVLSHLSQCQINTGALMPPRRMASAR
jgi:Leucine-rich repeat (LRR) protein